VAALGGDVFAAFVSGFTWALHGAEAGISAIWGWLGGIAGRVIQAFGDIGTLVWNYMQHAFSRVLDAITNGISTIWGWLGGLGQRIITGLGDIGTQLWNYGVHIMQRFVDGIGSMAGAAVNAFKSALGPLAKFVPFSPAKEGPLSGSGDPLYWGQNIIKRMAEGMGSAQGTLGTAMKNALGPFDTQLSGAGGMTPVTTGPAIVIQNVNLSDQLDVEGFMRHAAWIAKTRSL
jgi:phage-related protein